jgi:hypothetical protein
MNVIGTMALLVVGPLAAVALAVLVTRAAKRRHRSEALKDRFGPEYHRALDERGGRRAGEAYLTGVADRRDRLEIRALSAEERDRYTKRWVAVQAMVDDHPASAARHADHLVGEVMRARGYPVDHFGTKADMVAIDHPHVAEHYRAAHAVGSALVLGANDTEQQELAFVHFRALFAELVSDGVHGRHAGPVRQIDLTARDRTETPRRQG